MEKLFLALLMFVALPLFGQSLKVPVQVQLVKSGEILEKHGLQFVFTEPKNFGGNLHLSESQSGLNLDIAYYVYEKLPLLKKNFQFIADLKALRNIFEEEIPENCIFASKINLSVLVVLKIQKVFGKFSDISCGNYKLIFSTAKDSSTDYPEQ